MKKRFKQQPPLQGMKNKDPIDVARNMLRKDGVIIVDKKEEYDKMIEVFPTDKVYMRKEWVKLHMKGDK